MNAECLHACERSLPAPRPPRPAMAGFTLLEMLLALGLTAILMSVLGMAIHLYLETVAASRTEVQQAELARNLLQRIAADLHNAVPLAATDTSAGMMVSPSTVSGEEGSGSAGDDEGTETDDSGTFVETLEPSTEPGLYGTQHELQVDVARLPRIDALERLLATGDPQLRHRVSSVSTVAYYVGQATQLAGTGALPRTATGRVGLMRRSLDRAVTQWAVDGGALALLDTSDQLLAPEVAAIEFRYFDGAEWTTSWDTEQRSSLPLAVEIALALATSEEAGGVETKLDTRSMLAESAHDAMFDEGSVYRLLVHLPLAQTPAAGETAIPTGGE